MLLLWRKSYQVGDAAPSLKDIEKCVMQLFEPENLKGFFLKDLDQKSSGPESDSL